MLYLLLTAALAVSRNRFEDKVCLVTGATSGIGQHVAMALANEGCKVVFTGRRQEKGEAVQALIEEAGGTAVYVQADVTSEEDNIRMVQVAVEKFGRLDCAFNNAGVSAGVLPLHETSYSEWKRIHEVNLNGVFLGMKEEIKQFLKQGTGGTILNCNSIYGLSTNGLYHTAYTSTKHGLTGLTKSAALEYARNGIRINDLNPGFTDTAGIVADAYSDFTFIVEKFHPNGKLNQMKGVVQSALFALSDDSADVSAMQFEVSYGLSKQFSTNWMLDTNSMPDFLATVERLQAEAAEKGEEEVCSENGCVAR